MPETLPCMGRHNLNELDGGRAGTRTPASTQVRRQLLTTTMVCTSTLPPSQKPGSFGADQAFEAIQAGAQGGGKRAADSRASRP